MCPFLTFDSVETLPPDQSCQLFGNLSYVAPHFGTCKTPVCQKMWCQNYVIITAVITFKYKIRAMGVMIVQNLHPCQNEFEQM